MSKLWIDKSERRWKKGKIREIKGDEADKEARWSYQKGDEWKWSVEGSGEKILKKEQVVTESTERENKIFESDQRKKVRRKKTRSLGKRGNDNIY